MWASGAPKTPSNHLSTSGDCGQGELQNHNARSGNAIMIIYVHKDCGQPAVETPGVVLQEVPADFPFTCLYCLEDIEDESDLTVIEQMGQ